MMSKATNSLSIRVQTMTPAKAAEILKRNTRNRAISRSNYNTITRALLNGEWLLNGEAVKIAKDGAVLDGQHRLKACVDTGISFETILIEGLPPETQDTMDTGKSRSLADILSIRGEKSASGAAALIKRFILIERTGKLAVGFVSTVGSQLTLTNHECLAWFDQNQWVRDYVAPGKLIGRYTPMSGATAGVLMRTFSTIDVDDSNFFWDRVQDGVALDVGHPILTLRTSFRALENDLRGERNQTYMAALTIKAWNAYREGSELSLLRWRVGGAKPEAFPEPK